MRGSCESTRHLSLLRESKRGVQHTLLKLTLLPQTSCANLARTSRCRNAWRTAQVFSEAMAAGVPASAASPTDHGPLSPFKPKQNVLFQIVSARQEDWSEKTFCGRILLRNGDQMEVQATKAAFDQWNSLTKNVAYTAEIARSVLKQYKGSDKTGIQHAFFLRTQFRLPQLQRAVASFRLHVVKDCEVASPDNLEQLPEDQIFNVAGFVHSVAAPPPESGAALLRRQVVLAHGEWQFTVQFVGRAARAVPTVQTAVVVYSVKKHCWQGILALETTRLTWCLENPPWLQVPHPSSEGPLRKALRCEVLPTTTVNEAKNASGQDAVCVLATMLPLDESILDTQLWVGAAGDRMRLPITLRDSSGNLRCTLWSSEFGAFIEKNTDELSELYAACEEGDEAKTTFLTALNANADKDFRWTLRPRMWTREHGEPELQWHVAAVVAQDAE